MRLRARPDTLIPPHSSPVSAATGVGRLAIILLLTSALLPPLAMGEQLALTVTSGAGAPLPCRIHLTGADGVSHSPPGAPFWRGGFVCDGKALVDVPAGDYRYEVERGPEWSLQTGEVAVVAGSGAAVAVRLERLADLKAAGWFAGDLHVHRAPGELPLHLQAEDLSIASVQTWWNKTNAWGRLFPRQPVKESDGRFFHVLGGEDERGGGAVLYHRMREAVDITTAGREWPSSVSFLEQADRAGCWAEIEKPFWWDTPLWLATGKMDSVGIAQNHMQRGGMLDNEAWGRPRDLARYPGVHGNGLYTQDLYYRILNTGMRLPPSAGSASGVLPNPVGYNRVYVHTGADFGWDAWWDGLRQGRCFVTNGPLLQITANGELPGSVLQAEDTLRVTIEGTVTGRDRIERIELVENGRIRPLTLPAEIELQRSGWFLVRVLADVRETFRFASTAPWYVEIDHLPMAIDRTAVEFFLQWTRERRAAIARALEDDARRAEALQPCDAAIDHWSELLRP